MRLIIRTQLWAKGRIAQATGPERERGDALAWVLIAAATVTIVGLVYAAINGKVAEKIGIIKGS